MPSSNVNHLESYSVQPSQTDFFHLATRIYVYSMPFQGLITHFSLSPNNISLHGCTSLFIPSSTEGHLGCLQALAIMDKTSYERFLKGYLYLSLSKDPNFLEVNLLERPLELCFCSVILKP